MLNHRALGLLALCLVGALFLTGCITTTAPVQPLVITPNGEAAETAVAVAADGTKHYVWTECTGTGAETTCRLVYYRTKLGAPIYHHVFDVALGALTKYPDVAVTANGQAFVVRSICSGSVCTDYFSVMPPAVDASTRIDSFQLADPGTNSAGPPKVEARGTVVYATYITTGDANPRLRYRQLRGGTSGGFVEARPEVNPLHPSMAIDGNGKLHVTWLVDTPTSSEIAYGNNASTTGDFGLSVAYDSGGNHNFRNPEIALATGGTPYIVYAYDGGSGDNIKIHCEAEASSCYAGITTRTVPLTAAESPWRLRGAPQLVVTGSIPHVIFSAKNSATSTHEIWHFTAPVSGTDQGLERVTTNEVEDDEPVTAEESSNFGDIVVAAWRTYHTVSLPIPGPAPSVDCFDAVYMFYFSSSTVRQIHAGNGGCMNGSRDLAANGQWVAGVWVDPVSSAAEARRVPWTTFNAYTTFLPMVTK